MNKRFAAAGLGLALAAAALTATAPAGTAGASTPTIADVVLSDSATDNAQGFDKNWHDYDIVTQAVLLFPDLVAAVSDPNASLTVLAPNDQAFRLLVGDLTKRRARTEAEVFNTIAALGTDTVKAVLTYHIVGSKLDAATVLNSDHVAVTTLAGGTFTVDVLNKKRARVKFIDNDTNNRDPRLIAPDLGGALANGFLHGIDRVLRPIDL